MAATALVQRVGCHMQKKRLYWEKEQRWVSLRLSVKAMRTIKKKGLDAVAEENGVDLYSLPYRDVSENRLQWKASNPARPPMPKNPRFVFPVYRCRRFVGKRCTSCAGLCFWHETMAMLVDAFRLTACCVCAEICYIVLFWLLR